MILNSGYAKLYLYSGLTDGKLAWAKDTEDFRRQTKSASKTIIRVCSKGKDIPVGYKRTGGGFANDPIIRIKDANASFLTGLNKIGWGPNSI